MSSYDEAREAFRSELHRQADHSGHYVRSDTSLNFLQVEGFFDFNAAIDAFLAKLSETHAVVPRDIVNPFAKVASREEMHASTIGHKDMPDTQTVALLMRMGNQEYMDRSLTLGDFRAMLAAMLSAQEVKG